MSTAKTTLRTALTAAVASLALVLAGCGGGNQASGATVETASAPVKERVDQVVGEALGGSKSTQAVVGVWLPDGTAYVRGYGPGVDANTAIRAGQSTAPAMCALLLQFVAEGHVNLNDKVGDKLKRQTGLGDVTYRQLCSGEAHFADYKGYLLGQVLTTPGRFWNENELFAESLAHSPLPHAGSNVYLSDSNYLLLARAGRVLTAESTADQLAGRVFNEADMHNTHYPELTDSQIASNTLTPLMYPLVDGVADCSVEPQQIAEVSPSFLAGAGASITTAEDLHRFYTALFEGRFGGDSLLAELNKPLSLANPERDAEGNAVAELPPVAEGQIPYSEIALGAEKVGPLYGRAGWLPGTISATYHDPESGFTVMLALNNSTGGEGLARAAALLMAAELGGEGVSVPWTADAARELLNVFAICQ